MEGAFELSPRPCMTKYSNLGVFGVLYVMKLVVFKINFRI
jgi:hypothetical protein